MNKKNRLYLGMAIIMYLISIGLISIGAFNSKAELGLSKWSIMLTIIGVTLCILTTFGCVYLWLRNILGNDEEAIIEENDERNKMIRGKAAEHTMVLFVVVMVIVEGILIVLGDLRAAILVSVAMFVCVSFDLYFILYLQKKL
ncbi:hypothetical protein [Clostridium intestinale]|uniref:DUF2178 domain-containing protein n=1 Tax=Clostridium intestinale DSM 6191 TaxID=1121320 RepID=A0A1M6EZF9_9CLOT|nr:hypothetical protein [Clostridium intestinale]SHI90827.1 hypothetical protein SAMN02745941_04538 [Clostridium intestinale DSM 6191]